MRSALLLIIFGGFFVLSSCVEPVQLVDADVSVGVDAGGAEDSSTVVDATLEVPADLDAPGVRIESPLDGSFLSEATVEVTGTSSDDAFVASVFVRSGANVPIPATSTDGFRTWTATVPVGFGPFVIEAVAYDSVGRRSAEPDAILVQGPATGDDSGSPSVVIVSPDDGSAPIQTNVLVEGTAIDDGGVVRMDVYRNDELLTERSVDTEDFFASWVRVVPLLPAETNVLRFVAWDSSGNTGEATISLEGRSVPEADAPTISLTSPSDGQVLETGTVRIEGTASDRTGIREVKVRVGRIDDASGEEDVVWSPFGLAATSDGFATWSIELPIEPGQHRIEARAIDLAGIGTGVTIAVDNVFVPEWEEERLYFLRLRESAERPTLTLSLDEDGVNEVIPEEIQRDLLLLELDPGQLLLNTLNGVKSACGTAWREDNPNPNHDCSLTELGRSFRGASGSWEDSAEYSMVRLLTMTPANVVVEGTSIAGLQELADGQFFGIRIGGGFSQILADSLGIARTDEIILTPFAVDALQADILGTHPNTTEEGLLPVTMYDVLAQLETLTSVFGPAGDHPGIVDPASPIRGELITEEFRMVLIGESNLQWLDGVDLDVGKEYAAIVVDETGPSDSDVLEFDFTDPERFLVEGIVPRPIVDLRFQILENDEFRASCNGDNACQDNLPGSPIGPTSLWAGNPWEVEYILADAGRRQYSSRVFRNCYINFLGCQADVRIGQDGNPAGWTEFDILFDLGSPPRNQYLWELLSEVAQVALHRVPAGDIPEGEADVGFTMTDLEVGLSADEFREAIRPVLQEQNSELSERLLGDYERNNGNIDFFYRRGSDGRPYLWFIAPEDPRPVDDYSYEHPGFFDSPSLSEESRVSRQTIPGSGDEVHEKLLVEPGTRVVYAEDATGRIYRLTVVVPEGDLEEIQIRVARRAATGD